VSDALAEFFANLVEARKTTLIFHRVVEQRRDGHFFVTSVFNHDGSDTEEVSDIRSISALAELFCVETHGIIQRLRKAAGKDSLWNALGDGTAFFNARAPC
jgi:hypothetical protein